MTKVIMKRLLAAAAVATLCGAANAQAQTFPARPITIVSLFPAGSPVDMIARIVGDGMKEPLDRGLVIENVAGAKRAAPGGHHF